MPQPCIFSLFTRITLEDNFLTNYPLPSLKKNLFIYLQVPSKSILKTSLRMVMVVQRTKTENRNVQMGSATLYSGWKRDESCYGDFTESKEASDGVFFLLSQAIKVPRAKTREHLVRWWKSVTLSSTIMLKCIKYMFTGHHDAFLGIIRWIQDILQ